MSASRRGVALIIAISVLAALLFLALPFLFSQTASVAGARAAAWDGGARRGSDRAMGLATALATYATGLHRSPLLASQLATAQLAYVQIPMQIGDQLGPIHYPADAPNSWRTLIDTGAPWPMNPAPMAAPDAADVVHGATIEDESRRIEPNCLDMYGWAVVLKRAGIQDPWTVAWHWDLSKPNKGYWTKLTFGRLARALCYWRPGNGSRRFNRLEDLLGADPQQPESWYGVNSYLGCVHFGPLWNYPSKGMSGWPVPGQTVEDSPTFGRNFAETDPDVKFLDDDGDGVRDASEAVDTANLGWRVAPLTQAELERLRPLLSFLVPGQGRSGLIDLGTVVATDDRTGDWWGVVTDELAPTGTGVVGGYLRTDRTWTHSGTASNRHLDNGWAKAGDALAVDAIPALNLNTVPSESGMTRLYEAQDYASGQTDGAYQVHIENDLNWPKDPIDTPITSIGKMPLLRWLDPRTGDGVTNFERPPLGIAGFGIVALEGLSTVRDAQGNAVASRRRRVVAQAVPQERPIEAAWTTQGDFEALVRLRHGSWVVAGPHPTNRIASWGADASTGRADMAALDGPGWLEPAPLTTFSRNPAVQSQWRMPLGLTKAQSWDDVLKRVDGNNAPQSGSEPIVPPKAGLRASGTAPGALEAQGLRLTPGDRVAWAADGGDAGPLRFAANGDEFAARHVSLRFCLPDGPSGTTTIVEVRNQEPTRDTSTPADGAPDAHTRQQSAWRIEYRAADEQLVLVIANAALPWTDADRKRFVVDAWTTGTDLPTDPSDARCKPGSLPFAPALPDPDGDRAVEFRYRVAGGLQRGQWYHLQAFCASDRPGLHGLILDGVVGRDATRSGVDMNRTGDHYTWPCLRLESAVAAAASLPATGTALAGADLAVRFPVGVPLARILPLRGLVRIDDEYFSYTGQSDNGDGTGTLTGVQRARRQNTDQTSTEDTNGNGKLDSAEDTNGNGVLDPGEDKPPLNGRLDSPEDLNQNGLLDTVTDAHRWPVLQRHEAGALVTPGWAQVRWGSGRWNRGAARLAQPMPAKMPAGTVNAPLGGWPDADSDGRYDFNDPATLTITTTDTWPARGYVRFDVAGEIRRAAFSCSGTTLTLEWVGPATTGGLAEFDPAETVTCRVMSIEVDNDYDNDGYLQLLDPVSGRCEWIRTTAHADRTGQPLVQGRYFLHDSGWDMAPYAAPQPLDQPRGSLRTGWTDADPAWPAATTLVLPVQTQFDADRFESGDVVTLVSQNVVDAGPPPARRLPVQVVVRHACRDGFPATTAGSGAAWDTKNEYFSLAHPVPVDAPDAQGNPVLALIGRGWGGDDLSPEGNSPQRRGALPRLALLGTADPVRARVHFGGADDLSPANANAVLIDDLCSGAMQGPGDANGAPTATQANGSEIIMIGGSVTGTIGATAGDLPVEVTASEAIFAVTNGNNQYGLVQIDGEAFAFRRNPADNTRATLIARALFGTVAQPHRLASDAAQVVWNGGTAPTRAVRPSLPACILPLGPVAELCSDLPAGAHDVGVDVVEPLYENYYKDPVLFTHPGQESYANDPGLIMRPPFVLIQHPSDGTTAEVTRLHWRPASRQRITARWLRGLYGTTDTAWTAPYAPSTHVAAWSATEPAARSVTAQPPGALNPIIVGWWPRFAPGLTGSPSAESLRSRSFAWAGFALRLSGSRFDPFGVPVLQAAAAGICDVGVAVDGGCPLAARALAAEENTGQVFDWDKSPAIAIGTGANAKLVAPFNWNRFQLRESDGAELRIHWDATGSGATSLLKAADAAGRTPRLENVRLRCVAPNRVLAVEEVR